MNPQNPVTNIQGYWQRVRREFDALTAPVLFITSLDVPERGINPDAVCEVTAWTAARRLTERTHRFATASEVKAYYAAQDARDLECRIQTEKQKNNSTLALTPELAKQLGMLAALPSDAPRHSKGARGPATPAEVTA